MPKIYPITKIPEPILRQKAKPVDFDVVSKHDLETLVKDMDATMRKTNGVGIAAPQIGKSLALAIVDMRPTPLVLINPVIKKYSWAKENGEEGCLSVPGHFDILKRAKEIVVKTFTLDGKPLTFTAKGFLARVCQHEIDHLNGILFIDRIKARKFTGALKK